MKAYWRILPLASGLLALAADLRSQATSAPPAADSAPEPAVDVRKEMTDLVAADAHQLSEAIQRNARSSSPGNSGVIMMDPFIVKDTKSPAAVVPVFETPLAHFLKTGSVLHAKKKKVSLDVSAPVEAEQHGFAKPTLQLNLSW
jgi:hypothetical protein